MPSRSPSPLTCGFLGAGQMGEAILAGMLSHGLCSPRHIRIHDVSEARATDLRNRYGVIVETDPDAMAAASDMLLLAVKPQEIEGLLARLDPARVARCLLISIAAGKTIGWIEERLPPQTRVVRVMPNLAMRVGEGMSVCCAGSRATARDRQRVKAIFACSGLVREMPEEHFDTITALSGSGPAFLAVVLQAFIEGAVQLGMPPDDALVLARQTMTGTAKVLTQGTASLPDFVRAVTSAKGTTAAGLEVLERSTLRGIVARTLKAAAKRSRELARSS